MYIFIYANVISVNDQDLYFNSEHSSTKHRRVLVENSAVVSYRKLAALITASSQHLALLSTTTELKGVHNDSSFCLPLECELSLTRA